LGDNGQIGDKLASPAEISCDLNARKLRMFALYLRHGMLKQRSCLMQVQLRFAVSGYGQILQDFCLERCAKAFDLAEAVFLCGGLQPGKRGDTELLIEPEYLVGPKSRDRE
jgi:hypothetical protein